MQALSSGADCDLARIVLVAEDQGREEVLMPVEALEALREVLGQLAAGNAVQIVPLQPELSTQQAADILNVSRPYLIGLLDSGKIPHRKVGAHRRVKYADVMAYKKADDEQGRAALDVLTQEAERLGLGY